MVGEVLLARECDMEMSFCQEHIGDQEDIGTGPDQDPVLGTTADQDPVLEEWVRKLVAEWAVASARQSH